MFGGRSKELFDTKRILFEDRQPPLINILVITGEPGIGKTSVAHELFKYSSELNLDYRVATTVYTKKWAGVLPELAQGIEIEVPSKANESEIEEAILRRASERPCFLALDNIVELEPKLISFMNKWALATHSKLLLTTNEPLSREKLPSNCEVYSLGGITEEYVIHDLLGKQMVSIIEQCGMWNAFEKLNGNPQKMIYLRWRAPNSCDEVEACMRGLAQEQAWAEPLEIVLQRIDLPVDHFLALARVRVPEVDEALLAHLWDQLALGSTEHYGRSVQKLLDEKLLESIDLWRMRLSAGVHVQLQKPLLKVFGKQQIGFIDYFVGEYHRQQFSKHKEEGDYRLKDLESYVYYMIQSGNIDSAYAYVFEGNELEIARSWGLSIELERILNHFDLKLDALLHEARSKPKTNDANGALSRRSILATMAKVELGRVYKDLSRHEQCLEMMESARVLIESIPTTAGNQELIDRLRIKIDHFRGIAYSQTGRTLECIEAYFESIKSARQANFFSSMDALSLGYLAYELKFYDMDESVRFAKRAVEISRQLGNRNTLVKNLCSLGQIQSFAGKINESQESFDKAQRLCHEVPADQRELGRILVNSAVTYIAGRRWREADKRLADADKLFGESGDRRRKFMARAYQGIILYHKGLKDKGLELVHEAFQYHQKIGAKREMLYEALTLGWMAGDGTVPEISQISNRSDLPPDVISYTKKITQPDLDIFVRFWRDYYMPTLLY